MKLIEQDPAMISHKELAAGRWNTFSLMEQLAHTWQQFSGKGSFRVMFLC